MNINYKPKNDGSFLRRKTGYIKGNDNKFYRYNLIIDDYVFCENNIYLEKGEPKFEYFNNKERYILMDKYVVDRLEKKITLFNGEMDSFTKSISDLGLIKNIDLFKNRDNRLLVVNFINGSNLSIRIDENNNIIEYNNNYVTKIGNDFLKDNKTIRRISLTSVEDIGNDFLLNNNSLQELIINSVKSIGGNFLYYNNSLQELDLSNVDFISYGFMFSNNSLINLIMPNVIDIGSNFLYTNKTLKELNIPRYTLIGLHFLDNNPNINNIKRR